MSWWRMCPRRSSLMPGPPMGILRSYPPRNAISLLSPGRPSRMSCLRPCADALVHANDTIINMAMKNTLRLISSSSFNG